MESARNQTARDRVLVRFELGEHALAVVERREHDAGPRAAELARFSIGGAVYALDTIRSLLQQALLPFGPQLGELLHVLLSLLVLDELQGTSEQLELTPLWWTPRKGLLSSEIR